MPATRSGALDADRADAPPASPVATAAIPAQLAKGALRRLAADKLEPTPENYARAYRLEAGDAAAGAAPPLPERALRLVERLAARTFDGPAAAEWSEALAQGRFDDAERSLEAAPGADGAQLAGLIERMVRSLERSDRHWTAARKKESLQRVLANGRADARRLQQRLAQLVAGWESDAAGSADAAAASVDVAAAVDAATDAAAVAPGAADVGAAAVLAAPPAAAGLPAADPPAWNRVVDGLSGAVGHGLPPNGDAPHELAGLLSALTARLRADGPSPALVEELDGLCARAGRVLGQRHRLVEQLGLLCQELTESLTDLAENDSWAQGQCDAMRVRIEEGLSLRGVRTVSELLRTTRERQSRLRVEREQARETLKGLIQRMLSELDELGSQTGGFHQSVGRYADVIDRADSLESLAGVVREMVEESRSVQALVQQTQARLHDAHGKASDLSQRVVELETEMRRLSDEVSTDQLTQIANRRGLMQSFDAERARVERAGAPLSIGLLDIDNFKRLNDQMGHAVGDVALKSLAARVAATLRPSDVVARYGGEEFVVLLPDTPVDEGAGILTRLQRSLTGGLFMHEGRQVFVTFSAGVTAYRVDERIEEALERADQALYEAKRTGKNRTCIG